MHVQSLLLGCALAVAACGTDGNNGPASDTGAPVSVGTITTSQFGPILVGANGLALYIKAGDSATTSTCTGTCVAAWPLLTVASGQQAVGGPGVNGMFGTLVRPDGAIQATYNELPLYYWGEDKTAGDATGNGIDGFSVAVP